MCAAARPPGVALDSFPTSDLPRPARVLVVRPPSYERDPARRYPVLYFLHDAYGDARTLLRHSVAREVLQRMRDGRLPEFLLVAPGAPGSWFSDYHDGSRLYERFLTHELPREIQSRYRALSDKRSRGVTGISMGGYGAFKLALRHPELYGSVSALSGAIIPLDWDQLSRYNWFARWSLKRVFGKSAQDNSLQANDVWALLRSARFETSPFAAHLRAGTEDVYGLDRVAAQFGSFLNEHGIHATVVLEPGGHDWSYWRRSLLSIADWHSKQFSYDPS